MDKLPSPLIMLCLLLFMTIISRSSSARTLDNQAPSYSHHHQNHHKITFLMQNIANVTHPTSQKPATPDVFGQTQNQIPFSKPLGLFPPHGGIPLPQSSPTVPITGLPRQPLDVPNTSIPFPIRATLEELELGSVTEIAENLIHDTIYGLLEVGKEQVVFVASSEDGTSRMVAMAVVFAKEEYEGGLRFFRVHRVDVPESHIAVIGGIEKYHGANGYAVY